MRKTVVIAAAILLVFFLAFRLVYTRFSGGKEERVWYAQQLNYNFSAHVDTVIMLKGGVGKIVAYLTEGQPNADIEDSLNQQLEGHKSLRLLLSMHDNQLEFIIPGADRYLPGDSVTVSSTNNVISFFRNGIMVSTDELSAMLEGRGNFFTF